MSDRKITKREALDLITPVVDGEVDTDTESAFYAFLNKDLHVRKQFESEQRIKNLLKSRLSKKQAPEALKQKITETIEKERKKKASNEDHQLQDLPAGSIGTESAEDSADRGQTFSKNWLYAAAASLLILAAFWGFLYSAQDEANSYSVEEYTYHHFMDNNGDFITPSISTASIANAEFALSSNFDLKMTVPALKNAEFKGIVYSDFVPDFKAPLLEYHLPEEDEYIYIFAFDINKLNNFDQLVRSEDAVKKCVRPQDFHVQEVNGKHVVSWKWGSIWYAAISNHEGKELAALVDSLQ